MSTASTNPSQGVYILSSASRQFHLKFSVYKHYILYTEYRNGIEGDTSCLNRSTARTMWNKALSIGYKRVE